MRVARDQTTFIVILQSDRDRTICLSTAPLSRLRRSDRYRGTFPPCLGRRPPRTLSWNRTRTLRRAVHAAAADPTRRLPPILYAKPITWKTDLVGFEATAGLTRVTLGKWCVVIL